ncbi:hypothetical protein HEK616_40420 [Streptomyces nigrescens]|uniref:Uncharacterized protein n=1 Tax=Streptomyces nigrescens TaxID=1920 RepID=A0ABM7ZW40_STRNI|nr:hypothetical protein [Streptomyces nigrescens]BDM70555.1 hypothetical protein HEK616_40420 [Streptomyces nigrescens]
MLSRILERRHPHAFSLQEIAKERFGIWRNSRSPERRQVATSNRANTALHGWNKR